MEKRRQVFEEIIDKKEGRCKTCDRIEAENGRGRYVIKRYFFWILMLLSLVFGYLLKAAK